MTLIAKFTNEHMSKQTNTFLELFTDKYKNSKPCFYCFCNSIHAALCCAVQCPLLAARRQQRLWRPPARTASTAGGGGSTAREGSGAV